MKLKTTIQKFYGPGTNTVKAVVEYFVNYDIVDDRVVKKGISFFVGGPGMFEWDDMKKDYVLDITNARPAYKPSEVARLVNKYTGLSLDYTDIRSTVDRILNSLQNTYAARLCTRKKMQVEEDIQKIMTDAIRRIVKKYNVTFNQEDEYLDGDCDYGATTYSFKGSVGDNDFMIYMEDALRNAYETLKNE